MYYSITCYNTFLAFTSRFTSCSNLDKIRHYNPVQRTYHLSLPSLQQRIYTNFILKEIVSKEYTFNVPTTYLGTSFMHNSCVKNKAKRIKSKKKLSIFYSKSFSVEDLISFSICKKYINKKPIKYDKVESPYPNRF